MAQSGFEQYYYIQENTAPLMVPIVHIEGKHNWFTKVRYNYEEKNSLGVYVSKSFSKTIDLLEYSVEPLVGGVLGKFNGGSFGLNTALDYRNFFFHTQSQFTFSSQDKSADFFFGWYEVGYSPLSWLDLGASYAFEGANNHELQQKNATRRFGANFDLRPTRNLGVSSMFSRTWVRDYPLTSDNDNDDLSVEVSNNFRLLRSSAERPSGRVFFRYQRQSSASTAFIESIRQDPSKRRVWTLNSGVSLNAF